MIEGSRASDMRLRRALRPLAAFGIIHGIHEWLEMVDGIAILLGQTIPTYVLALKLVMLTFSFLSLAAFGSYLLTTKPGELAFDAFDPTGFGYNLGFWHIHYARYLSSGYSLGCCGCVDKIFTGRSGSHPGFCRVDHTAKGISKNRFDLFWERQPMGSSGICLVWNRGTNVHP